jgi:hypothetical protein
MNLGTAAYEQRFMPKHDLLSFDALVGTQANNPIALNLNMLPGIRQPYDWQNTQRSE